MSYFCPTQAVVSQLVNAETDCTFLSQLTKKMSFRLKEICPCDHHAQNIVIFVVVHHWHHFWNDDFHTIGQKMTFVGTFESVSLGSQFSSGHFVEVKLLGLRSCGQSRQFCLMVWRTKLWQTGNIFSLASRGFAGSVSLSFRTICWFLDICYSCRNLTKWKYDTKNMWLRGNQAQISSHSFHWISLQWVRIHSEMNHSPKTLLSDTVHCQ